MGIKRFYSNYASKDDADTTIKKLQSKGLNAEIGPMKPIINPKTGGTSHNQHEGYVGVYLIKGKEYPHIYRNRQKIDGSLKQSSPKDEKPNNLDTIVRWAVRYSQLPAMTFAPAEAINSIMDQQKSAYDDFVKKLKTSSQQELEQIIRAILYSEDLDNEMKVALSQIVCNSLDKLKEISQIR